MAAKKAVLSMVISCVMGAVFVFVALFAGTFFYTMNVPDVAPFNPEMAGHALGVAFLSFLMIIVPFKWVIYRKLGYGINKGYAKTEVLIGPQRTLKAAAPQKGGKGHDRNISPFKISP